MPNLAVVIVSWNVCDLLRRCLLSIDASLAGSGVSYATVVVDNASSDGTPAMLRRDFPHVRLLEPGRNLGFASGNNLALRELGFGARRGANADSVAAPCSYVLLLNPDTQVVGDALPQLVRYLETHPDVIAVGPRLQYADGTVQSSRRRFPTRLTFFWESTPLERLWPTNPWVRSYRCLDRSDTAEQRVDWLVGAALLVRGTTIARAGLLDEGFFMYSEELEWQYRLQSAAPGAPGAGCKPHPTAGGRIAYLPTAVVIHHEGKSSEQVPAGRHIHFQRSKIRLARVLRSRGFAEVLRIFLLGCYGWELAVESAKYLLGHRRDLRRQRIGVYAGVLRSRLR